MKNNLERNPYIRKYGAAKCEYKKIFFSLYEQQ
jgi:hypothetical protein